jgi:hypothetical protein
MKPMEISRNWSLKKNKPIPARVIVQPGGIIKPFQMKQKIIYAVFIVFGMNLLASPKECGRNFRQEAVKKKESKVIPPQVISDEEVLGLSPFTMLLSKI